MVNQCNLPTNPCNNGICVPSLNPALLYQCYCFPGQTGRNCEISVNLCLSLPCQYNGICNQASANSYTCTWYTLNLIKIVISSKLIEVSIINSSPAGTMGQNCQVNINECASNPCQNNGTCIEVSN